MDRARRTCGEIEKSYRILVVNVNGHTRKREDVARDLGVILRQWFQNFIIMAPLRLRKYFIASLLKYRVRVCMYKEHLFHVFIFYGSNRCLL
jgi:hypothetical protein